MTAIEAQAHPEYLALLESVLADPADDAPRLVISDWLEEHGVLDRAEVIRRAIAGQADFFPHYIYRLRREWGLFPTPVRRLRLSKIDQLTRELAWEDWKNGEPGPGWLRNIGGSEVTAIFSSEELSDIQQGEIVSVTDTDADSELERFTGKLFYMERMLGKTEWENLWWTRISIDSLNSTDNIWTRGFISEIDMTCTEFMINAGNLFRRQPITVVRLVDKAPFGGAWRGENDETFPMACLPKAILRWIENSHASIHWQGTQDELRIALSLACVNHGRSLASLPPLEPPS